jgi:hypothetical protein
VFLRSLIESGAPVREPQQQAALCSSGLVSAFA